MMKNEKRIKLWTMKLTCNRLKTLHLYTFNRRWCLYQSSKHLDVSMERYQSKHWHWRNDCFNKKLSPVIIISFKVSQALILDYVCLSHVCCHENPYMNMQNAGQRAGFSEHTAMGTIVGMSRSKVFPDLRNLCCLFRSRPRNCKRELNRCNCRVIIGSPDNHIITRHA